MFCSMYTRVSVIIGFSSLASKQLRDKMSKSAHSILNFNAYHHASKRGISSAVETKKWVRNGGTCPQSNCEQIRESKEKEEKMDRQGEKNTMSPKSIMSMVLISRIYHGPDILGAPTLPPWTSESSVVGSTVRHFGHVSKNTSPIAVLYESF